MLRDTEADSWQAFSTKKESVEIPAPVQKPDSRQEAFNMVKKLQTQGLSRKKIGRELGISRNTAKLYFQQDILVSRSDPKRTNIEVFSNYILSKMETPGYTNMEIINDIREMGYTGGNPQANQHISFLKETNGVTALSYVEQRRQPIPYIKRLSTRELAKCIGHSLNHIEDANDRSYMQVLFDNMPILERVLRLVKRFKKMLKTGEEQIQEWINSIEESKDKLSGLKTFARGLKSDIKAVQNAIHLRWSNGPVEGHVNRLKALNDKCTGGQALNYFAEKSYYSSLDDSPKLTKNLI